MTVLSNRRVNLKVSNEIYDILDKQSTEKGMNLSAYISHLIIMEEERREQKKQMSKLTESMLEVFKSDNFDLETIAKLIQNKGD